MNKQEKLIEISKLIAITNEDRFKEYLNRPVVSGFYTNITDKAIETGFDSTRFVHRYKKEIIKKEEFLQAVKQLRSLGKFNKTKLKGINKLTKFADDNYYDYLKEVTEYNIKFENLKQGWSNYEIHVGYRDDEFFNNYLQPLNFVLNKMVYRNTSLSRFEIKYHELQQAIKELDGQLSGESSYHTTSMIVA